MSIQDVLNAKLSKLNNTDPDWVIFVTDHFDYIKKGSFEILITDADRDRYLYKIDHFLRDNQCDINITWIAKMINDINTYDDFTILQSILIPNINDISNLYRLYRTSTSLS